MFELLFKDRDVVEPKHLEDAKIMSKTMQWQERENGRLKCFRVGKKIFYTRQFLQEYFELSAQNTTATQPAKTEAKTNLRIAA